MRLVLGILLFFLLPLQAIAACEGRDLRQDLTPEERAELDAALADIPFAEGNHWVARKGSTTLHLVGTLHTNDPRMDAVVERLVPILSEADNFYFEITQEDMKDFEQSLAKDFSQVLITSGPTLIDLIDEESWQTISALLAERGIPSWVAAKMQPWFLNMILGIPPCLMGQPDADYGMDKRLSELAEQHGIPRHSLETIEELMALFNTHPIEQQAQSVVHLADALDAGEDQLATMANAYLEEKHAEILQFARLQGNADSDLSDGEFDAEWAGFEEQLLVQRNENWLRHILAIRDETAVIAVGAGHLGGEHGLLNRLQQEGYTLERAEF
ncbi:polysaccharide biosynthesis protein GumN [Ruegeria marisrubri]|uniref:Polysaccharide biosynthesis protein GumN n=1 Tax=Ruegeria marisrubri TaxID=1685379 RepID=A0A0X3TCN3_9RHOB|nr:TraB/GumN family protein [Ruegeria marisrubri]KUJ73389.1 polysaccharide biosynthesis protein GumN [Ruegeria marisrubri]